MLLRLPGMSSPFAMFNRHATRRTLMMPWSQWHWASNLDAVFEDMLAQPGHAPIRVHPRILNRFEDDAFFTAIEKQREAEQREDKGEGDHRMAGTVKSYSYSAVTKDGETTSRTSRLFTDTSGRKIQRTERKLANGHLLVEESRRDDRDSELIKKRKLHLGDKEVKARDQEADTYTLMEKFDAKWHKSFYGSAPTANDGNLIKDEAASREDHPENSQATGRIEAAEVEDSNLVSRIAHLAAMHEQGLLSDDEFLAAKRANHKTHS